MKFADVVPVADVAVETANVRGREIAEAVVMQAHQCAIDSVIVDPLAPLRRHLDANEPPMALISAPCTARRAHEHRRTL